MGKRTYRAKGLILAVTHSFNISREFPWRRVLWNLTGDVATLLPALEPACGLDSNFGVSELRGGREQKASQSVHVSH